MSSPSSPEATGASSRRAARLDRLDRDARPWTCWRRTPRRSGSRPSRPAPTRPLLEQQAAQLGVSLTRPRRLRRRRSVELATRDDVDLVVVATGGVVSLRPVLAALAAGKVVATANKETLVAGGHLVMPLARELAAARQPRRTGATRSPARSPGCAPSTPSTRPSGSASSGRRWPRSRRLILTASRRPVPRCERRRDGRRHARARAAPSDLDDGRQDHDRLGDARQQGPGGHRGTLAVRCRLRRDRGGHPSAERRPLGRPVRGRLPQGPAGHPGHAPSHPVRHDLPRPPTVTCRAARPRRHGPARLPSRPTSDGSRRCASPARRA